MSYQTVSDILAGSQNNYDFQKKDLGGAASSGSGNSSSFGELVSFYKNENSGETGAFSDNYSKASDINNKVESDRAAAADEKARSDKAYADKVHSDKAANANDDAESGVVSEDYKESGKAGNTGSEAGADNGKAVSEADGQDSEKSGKNLKAEESAENNSISNSKNKNNSNAVAELGLGTVNGGKKVAGRSAGGNNSKDGKISKLTNKDFARMHEISGQKSGDNIVSDEKSIKNSKYAAALKKTQDVKGNSGSDKKAANKKLSAKELTEKLSKEESVLDDADKNAGIQNHVATVSETGRKLNISDKNDDDSDELLDISEKEKNKGQIFMDKDKKISVEDLRTSVAENVDIEDSQDNKSKIKVSEPKLVNENTANITMEMRQNVNANVMSSNGQTAAANGSNFQAMLNNQIQQSAPEFVKAGNLVLKDNNQGTINLLLRPDELGNVKLHLSLDGKNISGHITVATKEALEVFKDNAETLREAFIKSGFESASFDVAYSGNNGAGQENSFQQQNDGKEFVAKKVYENHSDNSDGEFDKIVEKNDKNKEYSINIVA